MNRMICLVKNIYILSSFLRAVLKCFPQDKIITIYNNRKCWWPKLFHVLLQKHISEKTTKPGAWTVICAFRFQAHTFSAIRIRNSSRSEWKINCTYKHTGEKKAYMNVCCSVLRRRCLNGCPRCSEQDSQPWPSVPLLCLIHTVVLHA